jgi:hypothetical protein
MQRLTRFCSAAGASGAYKAWAQPAVHALQGSSATGPDPEPYQPGTPRRYQHPPIVDSVQSCDVGRWGVVKFAQGRWHDGPRLEACCE